MAYIGNEPGTYYYSSSVEQFNGDGNEVNFNLTRSVGDAKDIEVLVNNVQQDPFSAYTASGSVLTFVEAPSVGVGNITVTHKAYNIWGMIPDATAVVPGSYGGTGKAPSITVQADGRLTYAANVSVYPPQSSNTGNALFTNGTDTYWARVDAFPLQTSNTGNTLFTDGTNVYWARVDALPSQTGHAGQFLTTNGVTASWANGASNIATPTLSGTTTAPEGSTITVTIGNYDASFSYMIAVSAGSYTRTGASISWAMPQVASDTTVYLTAIATSPVGVGNTSMTGSFVATATNVTGAIGNDTSIIITDFDSGAGNKGWTI